MIEVCAVFAGIFFVTSCWLSYKYSLARDDNEFLYDENLRLSDENRILKDANLRRMIDEKTAAFVRSTNGMQVDEDDGSVDSRWRI